MRKVTTLPLLPAVEAFEDQRVENRDAQCECNTYKNTPPPKKGIILLTYNTCTCTCTDGCTDCKFIRIF